VNVNITVTKSVSDPTPIQGQSISYTVTAINNGPDAGTNVFVTDLLPVGVSFSSASASVGSYNNVSGIWTIGSLANGASETLQIFVTVTASVSTTVTNTATIDADQPDPDPGDNSDFVDLIVAAPSADLIVNKTADNTTPIEGGTVVFTINLFNAAGDPIPNVRIDDILPGTVTYVTHSASQGTYTPGTGIWNIGTVGPTEVKTLTITVTVNVGTGGTMITNTATLNTSGYTETNPGNESNGETLNVQSGCGSIANPITNVTELIDGIDKANDEACFPGQDTLNLSTTTFTLTTVNNTLDGDNGLPAITSNIIINGSSSTIERGGAPNFRLLRVTSGGTLTLNNLTLQGGDPGVGNRGGALYNEGGVTLNSVTVQSNSGEVAGAVDNRVGASLAVNFSTLSGNAATAGGGGAIFNLATLTVDHSTIAGNTATGTGGGVFSSTGSSFTLTNSTMWGNTAGFGTNSGAFSLSGATVNVVNSTISGNNGGGITIQAGTTLDMSFTTITNNFNGSALVNIGGGTVTLKNSILGANPGGNCSGSITNAGGNVSDDAACTGFTIGTLNLGSLANNGGSTLTHSIDGSSAAFDGAADCLAIGGGTVGSDQRDIARPQGAQCDAGALEL